MAFQIPYIYDYITELCRQQAEVIQNHDNENFATLEKAKPDLESIRGLNLAAVMCMTVQVSRVPWWLLATTSRAKFVVPSLD
jgi:hypothetical protein